MTSAAEASTHAVSPALISIHASSLSMPVGIRRRTHGSEEAPVLLRTSGKDYRTNFGGLNNDMPKKRGDFCGIAQVPALCPARLTRLRDNSWRGDGSRGANAVVRPRDPGGISP